MQTAVHLAWCMLPKCHPGSTTHSILVPCSEDTLRTSHQCEPPTNVLGLSGIHGAVQTVRCSEAISQVVPTASKMMRLQSVLCIMMLNGGACFLMGESLLPLLSLTPLMSLHNLVFQMLSCVLKLILCVQQNYYVYQRTPINFAQN